MAADQEILADTSDWTDQRFKVLEVIRRNFPTLEASLNGDGFLLKADDSQLLVERIGAREYRLIANANGNPGDPRRIVGGGTNVRAADLLVQIRQHLELNGGHRR